MRIVYVSPLKALSYDIERNLRAPLRGIGADISVGLRTGDTPQKERRAMRKTPPDILITTPESLYLMLSSAVREILTSAEAVIVDEIHAVAQSKRGVAPGADLGAARASGERRIGRRVLAQGNSARAKLRRSASPERRFQRIGLSATQRPLERIAQFLVGPKRECEIVDAGIAKELDLEIVVPVEDMAEPGAPASQARTAIPPRVSRWPTSARSGPRSTRSC